MTWIAIVVLALIFGTLLSIIFAPLIVLFLAIALIAIAKKQS